MKILFDLDGTITAQETLPLIAKHFGVEEQISELTKQTIQGNVPFIESFIRRVFGEGIPSKLIKVIMEELLKQMEG